MKNHLLTSAFLLLSLSAIAQTKPGLYTGIAVESANVTRDQRLQIGIAPEIGYNTRHVAVSVMYHQLVNLNRASSLGLRVYGNIGSLYGIHGSMFSEADYITKPIDSKVTNDFEYRFGAKVSMELIKDSGILANAGYTKLVYNQLLRGSEMTKQRQGGFIGLTVEL